MGFPWVITDGAEDDPFTAADYSLAAWTYDPILFNDGASYVNGTVYLVRLNLRRATVIGHVAYYLNSAAVAPVANQNYVGVYSPAGTLLGSSAAGAADSRNSTGLNLCPLASAVAAPAGFVWAAYLFNAGTPASFLLYEGIPGASSVWNNPLGTAGARLATNGTGRTTLASTITPSANSTSGMTGMWGGIS